MAFEHAATHLGVLPDDATSIMTSSSFAAIPLSLASHKHFSTCKWWPSPAFPLPVLAYLTSLTKSRSRHSIPPSMSPTTAFQLLHFNNPGAILGKSFPVPESRRLKHSNWGISPQIKTATNLGFLYVAIGGARQPSSSTSDLCALRTHRSLTEAYYALMHATP